MLKFAIMFSKPLLPLGFTPNLYQSVNKTQSNSHSNVSFTDDDNFNFFVNEYLPFLKQFNIQIFFDSHSITYSNSILHDFKGDETTPIEFIEFFKYVDKMPIFTNSGFNMSNRKMQVKSKKISYVLNSNNHVNNLACMK